MSDSKLAKELKATLNKTAAVLEKARGHIIDSEDEIRCLRAEVALMRPVVEAAVEWRKRLAVVMACTSEALATGFIDVHIKAVQHQQVAGWGLEIAQYAMNDAVDAYEAAKSKDAGCETCDDTGVVALAEPDHQGDIVERKCPECKEEA